MQVVLDKEAYELRIGRYPSGDLSLNLISSDGNPVAELSLDLPGVARAPDEIVLKIYGENQEIAFQLLTTKFLSQTPRYIFVGGAFCPVCRIESPKEWKKTSTVSDAEEAPQLSTPLQRACAATSPPNQSLDSH